MIRAIKGAVLGSAVAILTFAAAPGAWADAGAPPENPGADYAATATGEGGTDPFNAIGRAGETGAVVPVDHRRHRHHHRRHGHRHRPTYGFGYGYGYGYGPRSYVPPRYDYGGDCHQTSKVDYWYGRRALIGGTACYDAYGEFYVVPGSRYVIYYID